MSGNEPAGDTPSATTPAVLGTGSGPPLGRADAVGGIAAESFAVDTTESFDVDAEMTFGTDGVGATAADVSAFSRHG